MKNYETRERRKFKPNNYVSVFQDIFFIMGDNKITNFNRITDGLNKLLSLFFIRTCECLCMFYIMICIYILYIYMSLCQLCWFRWRFNRSLLCTGSKQFVWTTSLIFYIALLSFVYLSIYVPKKHLFFLHKCKKMNETYTKQQCPMCPIGFWWNNIFSIKCNCHYYFDSVINKSKVINGFFSWKYIYIGIFNSCQ